MVQTAHTGKRGAAYNDISTVKVLSRSGRVDWAYNWAAEESTCVEGVDFVPMIWGADDVSKFPDLATQKYPYILGFNEPDMSTQANLSPAQAAEYYKSNMSGYSEEVKVMSPAVTSSTVEGMGLSWMAQFLGKCSTCNIAGMVVHWYGSSVEELETFISEAVNTASRYGLSEIWITEFALDVDTNGISDLSAAKAFIDEALPLLERHSKITRYSYFMCGEDYLLTQGELNLAGRAYISAST